MRSSSAHQIRHIYKALLIRLPHWLLADRVTRRNKLVSSNDPSTLRCFGRDRASTIIYVIEEHVFFARNFFARCVIGTFELARSLQILLLTLYHFYHHARACFFFLSFLPRPPRLILDRRHHALPHYERERFLEGRAVHAWIELRVAGVTVRRGRRDISVTVGRTVGGRLLAERRGWSLEGYRAPR